MIQRNEFGADLSSASVGSAAERFSDDAAAQSEFLTDPGRRALARYESETSRSDAIVQEPQAFGTFGANANGLLDMAGNVWEWTESCFRRSALDAGGQLGGATTVNCGVHVVEGRHRTYITDFIRDARRRLHGRNAAEQSRLPPRARRRGACPCRADPQLHRPARLTTVTSVRSGVAASPVAVSTTIEPCMCGCRPQKYS